MFPESTRDLAQLAIAIGIGIVSGGTIVRFLVNKWLKDRENFEEWVKREHAVMRERMESNRQYHEREDAFIRDRSHELSNKLGILMVEVANAKNDVAAAIAANKEMMEWATVKFDALKDQIAMLNVTIATLNATLRKSSPSQ